MAASMWLAPLCLGGCFDSGGIDLALRFPADPALAPEVESIAEVSLIYWEPGKPSQRVVRPLGALDDGPIDELEPGKVLRMAVELRSPTKRLIGFGRVEDPVEIQAGSTPISVEMRRPFVYLGSESGIEAMDATQEASVGLPSFLKTIDLAAPVQVAVPSYDGKQLAAVVARHVDPANPASPLVSDLHVFYTESHSASEIAPIRLPAPALDLALSSDGRYAIVAHGAYDTYAGGLSIIDLAAARAGQAVITPVAMEGPVGRLSVGVDVTDRVFALVHRIRRLDCASPVSTIHELSLSTGGRIEQTIPLDVPVQDLAAADDASFLVVADSCRSTLWRVPLRGGELSAFESPEIPNVSSVALWNNTIWAVTSQPPPADRTQPGEAQIRVVSLDLQGNTQTAVDLPPLHVDVEVPVFSSEGQVAALQVTAHGIYSADLAVAPGAGAIALLLDNTYFVQERIVNGSTFTPDMDIRTIDYLLLDLTTATAVQHVLTACEINPLEPAIINNFRCAKAPEQGTATDIAHEPSGISVLYGSR